MISERTRVALAAAKARGKRLGTPANLRNHDLGRARGRATKTAKARKRAADLAPIVADLRASGATSLSAIAAGLNELRIPTAREGRWSAVQVERVLERMP
jgi:DNA invertase Pin-like site-specific DNA recombinase